LIDDEEELDGYTTTDFINNMDNMINKLSTESIEIKQEIYYRIIKKNKNN